MSHRAVRLQIAQTSVILLRICTVESSTSLPMWADLRLLWLLLSCRLFTTSGPTPLSSSRSGSCLVGSTTSSTRSCGPTCSCPSSRCVHVGIPAAALKSGSFAVLRLRPGMGAGGIACCCALMVPTASVLLSSRCHVTSFLCDTVDSPAVPLAAQQRHQSPLCAVPVLTYLCICCCRVLATAWASTWRCWRRGWCWRC